MPEESQPKATGKSTKYSGLYAKVLKDGDLSFIGRFKIRGKNKRVSLGRRSEGMTLESAYVLQLQMMEKASQQISMEEDSAIEAPTLSDVFEEYLEAKKLHNGWPMNSEGRTLSIFKTNFKSNIGRESELRVQIAQIFKIADSPNRKVGKISAKKQLELLKKLDDLLGT